MNQIRKNAAAPSDGGDVSAFLDRVKTMAVADASGEGRLIFAMDATMSRQPTWDAALTIQSRMFSETKKVGQLQVQLLSISAASMNARHRNGWPTPMRSPG